ncbi:concanavalin A-like lectin/glucanase domain-containing protein [Leucosporidium creatinivorum]|uniref:Concanavalin A-like lectin/glucanase domain-containing protein n=1 Tax=Leucosporidium creatinivorum TaxID=106004 RepID=A0A1Y2G4F4_9BASI|nr:concanavalin A-like lectin/glucanase domain-containing protein [Leucosporidium creatinivorum]
MANNPFASPEASIHASPSMQSIQNTPYMVSSPSGLSQRRWVKAFKSRKVNIDDMQARTPYYETPKGRSEHRWAHWLFVAGVLVGVAGAAGLFVRMWFSIPHHKYCLVMNEQFDSLDTSIWQHEVQVGGFGNGEFEWTTSNPENSFVEDGKLYIVPTLTSDKIGVNAVTNGYVVNLTRDGTCTGTTAKDCVIFSNNTVGNISVIPPIQSARLTTQLSKSIRFGRVEVKAKMPTGDWIWPAIWMMPRDSVYGSWPASGEIDIVESKGNQVTHVKQQNRNSIRSSLHWGPATGLDRYSKTTDVVSQSRTYYNEESNVFGLEWDSKGISTWKGSRARGVFGQYFTMPFWQRGDFGSATDNGATYTNPWANATYPNAAPFDQDFFLILNVAVGGTNGYFEDSADKPWSNSGLHPANDFWAQRGLWEPTWPTDPKERGMVVDYVKMWRIAEPGEVCEA